MNIGIVGTGRVAGALGIFFQRKGLSVKGYKSRSLKNARKAAEKLGQSCVAFKNWEQLLKTCNIVIVATTDESIENVSLEIEKINMPTKDRKKIGVFHTSGAHSSAIFAKLDQNGHPVGSVHPLQSIEKSFSGANKLENTVFSIEGNSKGLEQLKNLLAEIKVSFFVISPEKKGLYHMAACITSNYVTVLFEQALSIFESLKIDKELAQKALYPLLLGTVRNLETATPEMALTGPISRGDVKTILTHIKAVSALERKEDMKAFYCQMGFLTLELAKKAKEIENWQIQEIERILGGENNK